MIRIEYPIYQPKIKKENNKEFIFDEVRKQWLVLTPEEWVRQNFIQYLVLVKQYPASLMSVEKGQQLNELKQRTDIVIYNRNAQPKMIIEC
ncbi:MAG TPA: type I restriction enzyme HsdR N-terminal domain-containing protein, partial [Bacteroidia bacterium]|nr:type I restriction enzyme HsdR N-terminal domain-containing protein [Bacteroidia bacterium]